MNKRDRPEKKKLVDCCQDPKTYMSYELGYNRAITEYEAYLKNKIKEMPVEYRELVNKYFGGYYE